MKIDESIKGYILDCKVRGRSRRTIDWYEQKLRCVARWLTEEEEVEHLVQVTVGMLRAFVLHIQAAPVGRTTVNKDGDTSQISPLTVKGYVQVIKGFFSWCYREELIDNNIAVRLKLPSVPDYLIPIFTEEHIRAMLDACDLTTTLGYRDHVIILVLLETGIRISELCGLRVQDVHDDYIRVVGKGMKEREVGISPGVAKILWKYIHQYRKPHNKAEHIVFINRYGEPLTISGVDGFLLDIKERSGITGVRVSAHTFRHTFACMYLEQGGEIYKLSKLMGHSSVEVTEEYLKSFNIRAARRDQEKFSPVQALDLLSRRRKKKRKQAD